MDDILELDVGENEFDREPSRCAKSCPDKVDNFEKLSGKDSETNGKPLNADDYITLCEAKKEVLQRLAQFEESSAVETSTKASVKSRLGVRETESVEDVEVMDYSESTTTDCDTRLQEEKDFVGRESFGDISYEKKPFPSTNNSEDLPRRPSMKILCKRLRVKWYENPVKLGKEIAEHLQEPKYALIINIVKILGGKKAIELFNETKQIQMDGGMKTSNGSRRRTSGGVFLTLLKERGYATKEEIKNIFKEDTKIKTQAVRQKRKLQRQRKQREKMRTLEGQNSIGNESKK